MSFPNGLVITEAGIVLQAKAQTGTLLNFSKIQIGSGDYTGDPGDRTSLVTPEKDLAIERLQNPTPGQALVGGSFNNSGLVTGFTFKELGVFADDPDVGEILYCYGNAGTSGEYIPQDDGGEILEKFVNVITLVGSASNVSATINESLVYVLLSELDNLVEANAEVSANTAARHSHTNKALLDTYTQTEVDLANAVSLKHSHANKTLLDTLTSAGDGESYLANDGTYKLISGGMKFYSKTTDPARTNDTGEGYNHGDFWANTITQDVWYYINDDSRGALWLQFTTTKDYYTEFYNAGLINPVVGDFNLTYQYDNYESLNSDIFTKGPSYMDRYMYSAGGRVSSARIDTGDNAINLDNYNTLHFDIDATMTGSFNVESGNVSVGVSTTKTSSGFNASGSTGTLQGNYSRNVIDVDVSGLSGLHFIKLNTVLVTNTGSSAFSIRSKFYKIWGD